MLGLVASYKDKHHQDHIVAELPASLCGVQEFPTQGDSLTQHHRKSGKFHPKQPLNNQPVDILRMPMGSNNGGMAESFSKEQTCTKEVDTQSNYES